MNQNKPQLERVTPTFGSSFLLKHYPEPRPHKLPKWHFHPEIELVYIKGGHGKRHIGSHVSYFENGDLILIGSNLPHLGFTDRLTAHQNETVIQVLPELLVPGFLELPEMAAIRRLFERARVGMYFTGKTKYEQGERLEGLKDLPPFERLLELLDIFQQLAQSEEYESLNVAGFVDEVGAHHQERFRIIQHFVATHYQEPVSLKEVSKEVNMTVPAFCRYFKKISGKTFVRYLNEYRVTHACKLLSEEHGTVAEVAFDSGFNSLSQFNRLFKSVTGKSPTAYRAELSKRLALTV
jgi:AraC-like DNA-binding protein